MGAMSMGESSSAFRKSTAAAGTISAAPTAISASARVGRSLVSIGRFPWQREMKQGPSPTGARGPAPRPQTRSLLGLGDFGTGGDLVRRHDAPERAGRVRQRSLVVGVEAVAVDGEHSAVLVVVTRRELQRGLHQLLELPLRAVPAGTEHAARAPVAAQKHAVHAGVVGDAKAHDRAAPTVLELLCTRIGLLVRILGDGKGADLRALVIGAGHRMAVRTHVELPAVVLTPLAVGRLPVDLLEMVLADVGDEEPAVLAVEAERVRIAQAIGPDLRTRAHVDLREALLGDAEERHHAILVGMAERIAFGDLVADAVGRVDVDAEQVAPQHVLALTGIQRIAFPARVTLADVEVAVGPELDAAAVVVVVRLRNDRDDLDRLVGLFDRDLVGAAGVNSIARDDVCAVERQRGVTDVEVPVLLELRIERHGPQTLLDETRLHFRA